MAIPLKTLLSPEQAILDQLSPLRDLGYLVRALPNKSNIVGEIVGNGVITLSWVKDDFVTPVSRSMGVVSQEVNSEWVLDIRVKELREEEGTGGLVIRSLIYKLLTGFAPPGGGPIAFKSYSFADRLNNVWVFDARFTLPGLIMSAAEDEVYGILEQVKLEGVIFRDSAEYPGDTAFVPMEAV